MMKPSFTSRDRIEKLQTMESEEYDVFVIGGGITGAGIALDAAARGMNIALVDMQDFAAGTSSRSTKLVHGGLRYLKQFEIKMVAEVGKERAIVYENGPHVTTPEWMLLPIYKGGTFGRFSTSFGLWVYDFLAGVRRGERRKMLSAAETLEKEPTLKKEGLKGGGYYVEYRTDDARLTIEVLKKGVEHGVHALNYVKVEEFIYEDGRAVGVVLKDQLSNGTYKVRAKKIINAAGPWVDTLRDRDKSKQGKTLHLTKGIHLVFGQKRFPLQQAIYFDTPDGRMVFAIPRNGKTYVGTTDTNYESDMKTPRMTHADREYVLDAIDFIFPDLKITAEDVESSWAGLRPLIHEEGKDPSEISRKDEIFISESGLITIAGGKLTGYRKMAESIVNLVTEQLNEQGFGTFPGCRTKHMPISGGDVGGSKNFLAFKEEKTEQGVRLGLDENLAERLVQRYGSNIDHIYDIYTSLEEEVSMPKYLHAILQYSIDAEMASKPIDFFIRRTGALFFDIEWVYKWKRAVIEWMADQLEWTEEEKHRYEAELQEHLTHSITPLDLKEEETAI
ncbi:glycerol-3-phosphate dehydrogenase/oxidase [Pseudalkalibacillus salsuginis]|uniref:glycerol-3-phosphate dehydrogenase/oxidase n=1 Tax=Pseudalkalibacillus salsuginis TaxID=2910972 RepID=UPI001F3115C1|nr:glycerol-3-phosphate dehydrogenase/oxidase [Pseudalkalibacillus salsuginis]MCF6409894.1 glycerol-3-phosphate dehydrogenase/oxidase [Pseudalkalibacillus salsuginis]